jgi:hypothetical protein
VERADNRITFAGTTIRFTVLASPAGGPDDAFRIAALVNPTVVVPRGAHVSIQVINADPDTAHGLVITASKARSSWMLMMTARPAFSGAAVWFLGDRLAHCVRDSELEAASSYSIMADEDRAGPESFGPLSAGDFCWSTPKAVIAAWTENSPSAR